MAGRPLAVPPGSAAGQWAPRNAGFGSPVPLAPFALAGSLPGMFSSSVAPRPLGLVRHPPAPALRPAAPRPPSATRCAPCDRDFATPAQLAAHVATHAKCSACDFRAAKKVVSLHEEEVHGVVDTGGVVVGRIETPEEIARWIEERKKNYPTEENLRRKAEEAAKRAREASERGHGAGAGGPHAKRARTAGPDGRNPPPPFRSIFKPSPLAGPGGKRRPLLASLLERDVRRERELLLQCARFFVANNFFLGAPLPPEEEGEEERPLIEVIGEEDAPEDLQIETEADGPGQVSIEDSRGKGSNGSGLDVAGVPPEGPVEPLGPAAEASEPAPRQRPAPSALPLADYAGSSDGSSSDTTDSEADFVARHAFALGKPQRRPRPAPAEGADDPGWGAPDAEDEVDFEVE
ncbi:hypothetical protein DFJ74DRAFT_705793 [Hyaloraphidium curvatum]|nr:hypothetical protein DFJ74DRAFT_705793 [Hyaloraphidium curvatum]